MNRCIVKRIILHLCDIYLSLKFQNIILLLIIIRNYLFLVRYVIDSVVLNMKLIR